MLDAIEDPITRQRIVFTDRSSDLVGGELFVAPGGYVPLHVHASQTERFEGVSGELQFRLGRRRRTIGAGESVEIAPGVRHGFRNTGAEAAQFLIELTRPRRGEEGLRTLFGLQRDGRVRLTRLGLLLPVLQVAVLFDEYLDEVHLPFLPFRVQRVAFRSLGRFGRRRGYTALFPEYRRECAGSPYSSSAGSNSSAREFMQ